MKPKRQLEEPLPGTPAAEEIKPINPQPKDSPFHLRKPTGRVFVLREAGGDPEEAREGMHVSSGDRISMVGNGSSVEVTVGGTVLVAKIGLAYIQSAGLWAVAADGASVQAVPISIT